MPGMMDGLEKVDVEAKKEEAKEQAKQDVNKTQEAGRVQVRTVMRAIAVSQSGLDAGAWPADAVDAYVEEWLNQGWELEYLQHVRTERTENGVPIAEQMLYVLRRGSVA